jgi:geranylgeranyl diphosphate synthase type II
LAFQIADDYLDVYADPAVFGKPVGGDIRNNKKSWMLLRAFEKLSMAIPRPLAVISTSTSRQPDRESLALSDLTAAMQIEDPQVKYDTVRGIYDALDVAGDARAEIARYTEKALSHIKDLDKDGALERFAQSLVGRVK